MSTRGGRCGTERKAGTMSGPRRSPNGATVSSICRSEHRQDGASRFARRPTRTPPARAVAPVPSPVSEQLAGLVDVWARRGPEFANPAPLYVSPYVATGSGDLDSAERLMEMA